MLTHPAQALLDALRDAGPDGLSPAAQDALELPMFAWRVNELQSKGATVGEDNDGTLHLVYDPRPGSSEQPTSASPSPRVAREAGDVGCSLDTGSLFELPSESYYSRDAA